MKQKEYIMNATTNYYGMFSEAGNSAVDAIVEAVKKIAKIKKMHSDVLFYHVALPMLESLEEKPEFEEAGDTAVREAVYTKLEDTGVIIHDPEF
jgi:AmiR/NasT family two-component response regulator